MTKSEYSRLKIGDKIVKVDYDGFVLCHHTISEVRKKGKILEIKLDYPGCPFFRAERCGMFFKEENADEEFIEIVRKRMKQHLTDAIDKFVDDYISKDANGQIRAKHFVQQVDNKNFHMAINFDAEGKCK